MVGRRGVDEKVVVASIKLCRTRGLNPRVRPKGRAAASPLWKPHRSFDFAQDGELALRGPQGPESMGRTTLCPPQEAGFTLNRPMIYSSDKEDQNGTESCGFFIRCR
jgi:hypothetical protein